MQVKTFRAKNSSEALSRVKQTLGSDAVILDTKNFSEDGKKWCEITAAMDAEADDSTLLDNRDAASGWNEFHKEWDVIKKHMMTLIKPQLDLGSLAPRQRQALEFLEREGVSEGVTLGLFDQLKKDSRMSILQPLGKCVTTKAWGWKNYHQKIHVLTGPSGSGKTTSLLRMAMACHAERPNAKICIANADALGGRTRHYLRHFAELSGMTYKDICNARDIRVLLSESQKFDRIFIDLPSSSHSLRLDRQLELLGMGEVRDMAVHLVLSPHYAPGQFELFTRRFASAKCASIIWTKLDEACNFGAVLNTAYATGLPVAALSIGTGLRGTLVPAETVMLWKLVFKHQLPDSPLEEKRGNDAQ